MDEPKEGRCSTCGFMSLLIPGNVANNTGPSIYVEASEWMRTTGEFQKPYHPVLGGQVSAGSPGCICQAAPIDSEYYEALESAAGPAKPAPDAKAFALNVIRRDRKCPQWIRYKPGFSPKEHLEERRMNEQAEMDRRWRQRQEKVRRKWEHGIERVRGRREDRTQHLEWWIAGLGLLLAALSILTMTPDSPLGRLVGLKPLPDQLAPGSTAPPRLPTPNTR